jgi:uncharacterized protein YodC (DUF2158 family)
VGYASPEVVFPSSGGLLMSDPAKPEFVPEFKPGDLVMLKSGGPVMTMVRWEAAEGAYVCYWFDVVPGSTQHAGGDKHGGLFGPGALKKAKGTPDGRG